MTTFLCFAIPLLLAMAGMLLVSLPTVLACKRSREWPSVRGQLLSTDTGWEAGSVEGSGVTYYVKVQYTYNVDGHEYSSRVLHYMRQTHFTERAARATAERLRRLAAEQGGIDVYYNPDKPSEAVLIPGLPLPMIILYGGFVGFAIALLVAIVVVIATK